MRFNVPSARLGPLASNGGPTRTHDLLTASPALNNASAPPFPPTDQRGVARPQGFGPDIGSLESTTAGCTGTRVASSQADSWIAQDSPRSNFGNDSILKLRSKSPANNFRALVRFTLPAVGSCTVASATLRVYVASASPAGSPRTLQAFRLATAWSELGVTWNNQPATTGAAATTASGLGWREWSVTGQVQAMYAGSNTGFLIRDAVEGSGASPEQSLHSREKGTDRPPELVITYN